MSATTIARPETRTLAPRGFALRVFANEAGKGLRLVWRRRGITITGLVVNGFFFLMLQFLIGGGHLVLPVLALTLPGLFAYVVASTAALQGAGGIAEEVNAGTLEQAHLSPAPPFLLALGRLAAIAVEGLVPAIVLVLALGLGYGPRWVIRPDALVPLVLVIADGLAYGLVMTALVLRVPPIGAIVHVFNMAIGFFGGMFIPITVFPHGVEIAARFVPTALGTEVLNTTLAGGGLGTAWLDGPLPWLLVHVAVLAALGWGAYLYTVRRARREGGVSPA